MRKYALAVALLILALCLTVWGWKGAKKEEVLAQASAVSAEGSKGAAQDAIQTFETHTITVEKIDRTTKENAHDILMAEGSAEQVGVSAHSTALNALCLRHTYRDEPSCKRLLDAHPSDTPQSN